MGITTTFLKSIGAMVRRPWGWIALAVLIYTPFINTEVGQGNVASDLAAIESLVERGTFFINGSTFENTIDKFKREDGQFFSQKSPIFHLVAAGLYWVLHAMGYSLAEQTALCLVVLTFFMVVLPMGWLLWLVYSNPWMARQSDRVRVAFTLVFALGSLLTPFALTLNHYILASACLMASVNAITRYLEEKRALDAKLAFSVGFWISASLASDIPPAFIFGMGVVAVWIVRHPKIVPALIAGAAPLMLLYAALNVAILGSTLPPNMHEREMLYFEGSYWKAMEDQAAEFGPGYYQASYARRVFHSTLGYKGIYWMMPLLVIALLSAVREAAKRTSRSALAVAWALFPIVTIALTMRWAIDLSGGAYGIRHAFAALPPLFCALGLIEWRNARVAMKATVAACAAWGILIAIIGAYNPWSHNTLSAIPPLENLSRFGMKHISNPPRARIEKVIELTSVEPANGWLDLGLEYWARNELDNAERALRRAIEANPKLPLPYYHLGVICDLNNKPREAIQAYQKLVKLQPDNVGVWNNLGIFAIRAGEREIAQSAYRESIKLEPKNAGAMLGLLLMMDLEGKADANSEVLAEALRLHPQDERIAMIAKKWELMKTRGERLPALP